LNTPTSTNKIITQTDIADFITSDNLYGYVTQTQAEEYLTKDYINNPSENDDKNHLLTLNDIIDLPERDPNILPEFNPEDLKLIIKKAVLSTPSLQNKIVTQNDITDIISNVNLDGYVTQTQAEDYLTKDKVFLNGNLAGIINIGNANNFNNTNDNSIVIGHEADLKRALLQLVEMFILIAFIPRRWDLVHKQRKVIL
jgi:hypothetical protein